MAANTKFGLDIFNKIRTTKYLKVNKFYISFGQSGSGAEFNKEVGSNIMYAIVSVELPQNSVESIEQWTSEGRYSVASGKRAPQDLSITWRDVFYQENNNKTLWSWFCEKLNNNINRYFEDSHFPITVSIIENGSMREYLDVNALLTDVSGVMFNQDNDQIIEFTTAFKIRTLKRLDSTGT